MRVTALLPTHDLSEEAVTWMEEARSAFDGLVVFLDEKRVTPGTAARVQKVATRVVPYRVDSWYEWDISEMARQCDSDWLFLIERDEQLSPGWHQQGWRAFLEDERFTHYLIPR